MKLLLVLFLLGVFILLLIIFIAFISSVINKIKRDTLGYIHSINIKHIKGIPNLNQDKDIKIYLYKNEISIDNCYNILYSNINDINIKTEYEITEQEKSVIGRGIAGGLLFGPVGAIISGMSGISATKIKKDLYFMFIDFLDKDKKLNTASFVLENKYLKPELDVAIKLIKDKTK